MKTVFMHIGTHKTGSTAIQKMMSENALVLQDEGILYPQSGRPIVDHEAKFGHHRLAWSVLGRRGISGRDDWHRLIDEIETSVCNRVVLSSEVFESFRESHVEEVAQILEAMDVTVVVYLRSPMRFMRSLYAQRVKTGKYAKSFSTFIDEFHHLCDYSRLLERWSDHFGIGNIQALLYEKCRADGAGVETSFLKSIQVGNVQNRINGRKRLNVSPGDESVSVVRWLNVVQNVSPKSTHDLLHRIRRQVLRNTGFGRAMKRLASPIAKDALCGPEERHRLEQKIGDRHREFLQTAIAPEDREYLEL